MHVHVMHVHVGESAKSAIVEHVVVVAEKGGATTLRVQCVDDEPLDLDDGDTVAFAEVRHNAPNRTQPHPTLARSSSPTPT